MRLCTFFWMMPLSISLSFFSSLVFLLVLLFFSLPALVFLCLLLYKWTKTVISLHITLEENYGYFHRISVFCSHFFFFLKCSTPCWDPQSACQSRAHYSFFKWTSRPYHPESSAYELTWIVLRECIDLYVKDRSWIDHESAKKQRWSWTCCRAWQA